MKTSTQITSDACNLVNWCNSGDSVLTDAGKKKRSEKRLSLSKAEGPSFHLSVLKVESWDLINKSFSTEKKKADRFSLNCQTYCFNYRPHCKWVGRKLI